MCTIFLQYFYFSQQLKQTKTGRTVRPPDKFRSGTEFDAPKLFKKALMPKLNAANTDTIAAIDEARYLFKNKNTFN